MIVEVSDTGVGIDPGRLPRLFDPFYTTRPVGKGAGLGLAIGRQVVGAHGGTIEVESEPGRGSVFRMSLPAASEVARPAPAPTPAPALAPTGGRGRVLVVDDEPAVSRAVERTLRGAHDITVVASARLALERIAAGEAFELILSDLMMPGMTGMDLYEALFERDPALAGRVVFLTGGAVAPRAQAFLDTVDNPRVFKPFNSRELRALVAELIAGAS